MERARNFWISLVIAGASACAPNPALGANGKIEDKPALIVLLVVDQLRADLLDRYDDLFAGGFRRLRDEGYSYDRASQAHAATETAVGHASLSTGVYPNRHGVIGNLWFEQSAGRWVTVENIADSTVKIVGSPAAPGASPSHLMRSGFAEWLVAADPRSIVASVSGKNRGAIQPAAHTRGYVYWFNAASGTFVTSTYYRQRDPEWISRFNSTTLASHRADTVWELRAPSNVLSRANRDTIATEGNGTNTFFPHKFSTEAQPAAFWTWWGTTPYLDAGTLDLAELMVTSLGLGRDEAPDFLNVSLSATDLVGHIYGPSSREQLDNLLRLDKELGEFFALLDEKVGRGRWTMMLSADHGVLDSPEDRVARGDYGHRLTTEEVTMLESMRQAAATATDARAAATKLATDLKKLDLISEAYTHEGLMRGQPRDSFEVLERRSLYPGRAAGWFSREGVEARFRAGVYRSPRGSGHGTAWWYDRHVPMIFMGPGIPRGRDASRAETVDFAPTAAALLRIPYPSDLDGKVLTAVLKR